jgi:hypothetical protein
MRKRHIHARRFFFMYFFWLLFFILFYSVLICFILFYSIVFYFILFAETAKTAHTRAQVVFIRISFYFDVFYFMLSLCVLL